MPTAKVKELHRLLPSFLKRILAFIKEKIINANPPVKRKRNPRIVMTINIQKIIGGRKVIAS